MNCEECTFYGHLEECITQPYEVIERVFDVETRQYITTRQIVTVVKKDRSESNENFRPKCKRN